MCASVSPTFNSVYVPTHIKDLSCSIVFICFLYLICVSVLLFQTVLSEFSQEKLVTEDEAKGLHVEGDLPVQLVTVQCTKPPEMVTRSSAMLDKHGYNESAGKLRGW